MAMMASRFSTFWVRHLICSRAGGSSSNWTKDKGVNRYLVRSKRGMSHTHLFSQLHLLTPQLMHFIIPKLHHSPKTVNLLREVLVWSYGLLHFVFRLPLTRLHVHLFSQSHILTLPSQVLHFLLQDSNQGLSTETEGQLAIQDSQGCRHTPNKPNTHGESYFDALKSHCYLLKLGLMFLLQFWK